VQDPEIASDLMQETFRAALRIRHTYAGRSSVRTWLVAILKHKIADHIFLPPDARERVKDAFLAANDRGGPVNSRAPTD
jgi:DNA-directed RNA polymerase specialized sigma24 family protein